MLSQPVSVHPENERVTDGIISDSKCPLTCQVPEPGVMSQGFQFVMDSDEETVEWTPPETFNLQCLRTDVVSSSLALPSVAPPVPATTDDYMLSFSESDIFKVTCLEESVFRPCLVFRVHPVPHIMSSH